jgi:hypothetical protein
MSANVQKPRPSPAAPTYVWSQATERFPRVDGGSGIFALCSRTPVVAFAAEG